MMKLTLLHKQNHRRIIMHIVYWLCLLLILPIMVSRGWMDYLDNLQTFLFTIALDILVVYFIFYALIPKYVDTSRIFLFVLFSLLISSLSIFIQRLLVFYVIQPEIREAKLFFDDFAGFVMINVLIYVLTISIKLAKLWFEKIQQVHRLEKEKMCSELKLKEAENQLLKAQLHPHFLFNTLNNLYGSSLANKKEVPGLILKISGMLQYMLYECNSETVLLSTEIDHIKDYIDLERLRYGKELSINFESQGIPEDLKIAPLILFPFVENSFKHSAEMEDGKIRIDITILLEGQRLFYRVRNSYHGGASKTSKIASGVGLENVKKRLELQYQDRYSLTISDEEREFIIELKLQLEE